MLPIVVSGSINAESRIASLIVSKLGNTEAEYSRTNSSLLRDLSSIALVVSSSVAVIRVIRVESVR